MAKVKITDQDLNQDGIGPLPDGPDDLMDGPPSPSTGGEGADAVSEAFAGDLIGLPFEAFHVLMPVVDPLSRDEKARLAAPFAEILNKYNLGGKLSRAEIVFGFYLTAAVAGRVKAVSDDRKLRKAQAEMLERNAAEKGFEA